MSELAELYRSNSYSHRVAAEVRAHAARQGIAQKDLAEALGYVPSQISKRMRGTIAFTLDELATLAALFGIEPAELMPPRPPAVYRPKDGAEVLPRLDLNQQPFGHRTSLVTAWTAGGGSVVPLFAPGDPRWTKDPDYATRPDLDHPFRPILITSRHLVAI